VGFVVNKVALLPVFDQVLHCFFGNYHSISAPYSHLSAESGTIDSFVAAVPRDPVSSNPRNIKQTIGIVKDGYIWPLQNYVAQEL
jgi:hypothetical protein